MKVPVTLWALAGLLLAAACVNGAGTFAPASVEPHAASQAADHVPATDDAVTAVPPAAPTASASPTAAEPTSSPVPDPTAARPPTATPQGQLGPEAFPPDVNPLTGLAVADVTVLERRPLAIKISNSPDCVRPQDGIARADIVFEHYAEGGTTRFTALYLSGDAAQVGSVRSARLLDLEIPAMYQSMFAFSGASGGVKQRLEASDFIERILSPDFEPGHPAFFRKPIEATACDLPEHTLFTGTDRLWATTTDRGLNTRTEIPGMAFNPNVPPGGEPAAEITVRYVGSYVFWGFDETKGEYLRRNNGSAHVDGLDGQPVTAANVVAVFANHVTTDILEDFVGYNPNTGAGGNYSVEIQIWGAGRAVLFRDGQAFEVNWARWERNRPPAFTDTAGNLVPFRPGVTWFQIAPLDTEVEQTGPGAWKLTPPRPSALPSFLTPSP